MPQKPRSQTVAYARRGALRPRRGTNGFAVASLIIGLILALGNILLTFLYKSEPKQGGWDGLGWFFATIGLLGVVMVATYVGAPIGLVCAILAILEAREEPRLRANSVILFSLLLLVGDLAFAIFAHTYADRELDRGSTPSPPTQASPPPKVTYTVTEEGWKLAQYCQLFAAQHDGNLPPSLEELDNSPTPPDPSIRRYKFYYAGAGLRITDRSDPTISRVVLLIANERLSDGSRVVVGIDGAISKVSSMRELTNVIERNNEVRERHHWPQISYMPDD